MGNFMKETKDDVKFVPGMGKTIVYDGCQNVPDREGE